MLYDEWSTEGSSSSRQHAGSDTIAAVEAFRAERGITAPLERVDAGCVAGARAVRELAVARRARFGRAPAGPPLAPRAPDDTVDLSVVVVFFNMRREAARTLHSLSRAYQEGIDDVSYEVIVVENGSSDDQKLGAAFVEGFGSEFRYLDLGADAAALAGPAR